MKSTLLDSINERVLVFDGAMGTTLHAFELSLSDHHGLENCNEILNLTRPDVVERVHASFLEIGCDAVMTNTFGAARINLDDFGIGSQAFEINRRAAEIARAACSRHRSVGRPRFVVGSMGPGTKLPTLGQVGWNTLLDSYAEQARGLLAGGVDALLVETCQDLLQAKCAIVACTDAMAGMNSEVPIFCTFTVETTGTMLLGTEPLAALVALSSFPQVKAIGLNCATGPQEMSEHVRLLSDHCPCPILVQPNAGLPELIDGQPHFPLTPAELAGWLREFIEQDGVGLVGGCCGTTPDHLRAVVEAVGTRRPATRHPRLEPSCSSLYQAVTLRQENDLLAVGERTNANGSKRFREMLAAGDLDGMVQMGREQVRQGSHVLDVCAAYVGRDEAADMARLVERFAADITVPLMIDSTETAVLESALQRVGGKCIINSINLEEGEGKLDLVCQLARRYGAAIVALTIDEDGMAKTAERKLCIARRIHDLVTRRHGIAPSDLMFDALTFTLVTGNEEDRRHGMETLDGLRQIKDALPGVHTILGLSNISFGLKPAARRVLNSVFLHHAREAGLDGAILHSTGIEPLFQIDERQRKVAEDVVFDRRAPGYDPLKELLEFFADDDKAVDGTDAPGSRSIEERLKRRVVDGDRVGLDDDLTEALATYTPLDIINDILLDGMKTVGDLFGAGQMQLPFVLQSAETMKAAVAFLEPCMDCAGGRHKGKIVLATVRGDVHDIGKNLVDIILSNNGYKVHNLGIKQPINAIVDAWAEHEADAIGMSGLLVKSAAVMRENLAVLQERGLAPPVILGGAALTRKFVERDLEYAGPLFYAKDAFDGLRLMDRIMDGGVADRQEVTVPRTTAPPSVPMSARSTVARDVPVPTPPFWGARVVSQIALQPVLAYINKKMLFKVQWQYRRGQLDAGAYARFVRDEVEPIYRSIVEQADRERILEPKAVYGYWPCAADGDSLIVFDPEDRERELCRFDFPRQRKEPYWCLSDFFRPIDSGETDVVAMSVVTVGAKVTEEATRWLGENRYRDYLHLHGLGVESAEALAEYLHKQIRAELGIAQADALEIPRLWQQRYQGSRYSFGYPACPRLEDQLKLWPLLRPERIGVTISEEFQLDPEQSTSAMVCHHPEARYFNAR